MPIKIVDVDTHHLQGIHGLCEYDAVEILFRTGREPRGRARVPCRGDSLSSDQIRHLAGNLPAPSPLPPPGESLPSVTVAVCTRNRSEELAAALRSLVDQEHPAQEILVVDNGCQQEVRELVENILPDARYIPERRQGLNFARNRSLSEATGEIIAFLDDDAVADPYWVLSIAEGFSAFPDAGTITGLTLPLELETPAQELFEANGGFGRGFERRVLSPDGKHMFPALESISNGNGCNMAFRAEALKKIEGFDEALDTGHPLPGGGDLDAFYRVMRAGYHHIYEPSALVRHRHRRSSRELRSQLAGHHRSLTAFLVKTVGAEKGLNRCTIAAFLAWRLVKPLYRLIPRLLRRDPLPVTFLIEIALATFAGLGSYQASKQRSMISSRVSGGRPPRVSSQLSELRSYRELVWNLTARDLKVKYQRSWLGFLWTLLNPLITVTVLVGVFSYVVRLPIEHYWAFLISGYFVWSFFSQTLNGGVQAAVGNAYLTRSSYFPQEVLVVSSALARFIEFIIEMAIVMLLLAVFHHGRVPLSFLMAVPMLPILFLLAVGISFPLVNIAVYYHDAIQAIPLATMLLFYVSPVFYSVEFVPENIRTVYMLNPVAALLTLFHDVLYAGRMPSLMVLSFLGGLAFFTFLLGYSVFNRNKREFAEIV